MSNTHPLVIVIFVLLFGLAVWSHFTAKTAKPTKEEIDDVVRRCRHSIRALQRRTDPVWKDRGSLK